MQGSLKDSFAGLYFFISKIGDEYKMENVKNNFIVEVNNRHHVWNKNYPYVLAV